MRRPLFLPGIFITCIALTLSCKKTGDNPSQNHSNRDSVADITAFTLTNADPQIEFTAYSVNMRFPDTVTDASDLVASFTLSPGSIATINGVKQVSGVTKNNFEMPLTYVVTNANDYSKHWRVTASNNNYTNNWGLGYFLKQSYTNDRSYPWYFNQANTGTYSNINCAPSCATMAAKWYDSTFSETPKDARDHYPRNISLWGLHTIQDYLADFNIQSQNLYLGNTDAATKDSIKKQLDQYNIVVLALNVGAIRSYYGTAKDARCDKYYPDVFNHCVVAYGYKEVGDEFYFQCMDPWGFSYTNQDGTCKGISRYYRYEDIFYGCMAMDNIALTVYKK